MRMYILFILYIIYLHIKLYVVFYCELCAGLMLDQRGRRWAAICHPFGRRNYICRMLSVIFDASIRNERWADAGLILSQRCRQWVGIEPALARRLCVRQDVDI